MTQTLPQQLADKVLAGGLEQFIRERRDIDAPMSWDRIGHELSVALDVYVSGETVRRWYRHLEPAA